MKKLIEKGQEPLIAVSLTGHTKAELQAELAAVLTASPDVVEWRADFFDKLQEPAAVLQAARMVQERSGGLPCIFTVRSQAEGGESPGLAAGTYLYLLQAICTETAFAYVDYELRGGRNMAYALQQAAAATGTLIIGSCHYFNGTPAQAEIVSRLSQAADYGFAVGKVAVMPHDQYDILTLLAATAEARERLPIPVITMAMGRLGRLSRMVGGVFGSALTFAAGTQASAPGQLSLPDLREALRIMALPD